MIDRIKNFSWYAFVFLLPWQTVWILREVFVDGEKWQYATMGVYASDVALVVFSVLLFARASREMWRAMSRDVFTRLLVALFAWTLLSSLWALEGEVALLSAWRVFLLTLAYLCARYGDVSFRKTIGVFLFSMTMQAMLALSQWAMQSVPSLGLLGIAEHESWRWGSSVLKTESGRFLRAYGGFEHPNVLGGALAIATLLGAWLSATAKRIVSRGAFLGMTTVSSFALVFTFSRSAWMAFGIGMGVIGCFVLRMVLLQGVRRSRKRIFLTYSSRVGVKLRKILFRDLLVVFLSNLKVLFFVGGSFFIGMFLVHDIALSRFSDETLAREGSLSDRALYLKQSFVAIREHPIFGVGGGNFTAFSRLRFSSEGKFVGDFQPVHAVPILVFAEIGAIGFFLYSFLLVEFVSRASRRKDIFAGMIFCALLPLLFLDHWMWTGHFGALFFGILFGLCARGQAPKIPLAYGKRNPFLF